jgi:CheY-like chemotaxis protein
MKISIRREIVPLSEVPRNREPENDRRQVVLVVDDEPLVAETLALILSGAGFAATAVKSGREALTLAQKRRPAFLLTDIHMPGMTGVELALTFTAEFPECKVLLFSGRATAEDLLPAVEAGIELPMLAKPIHPTEIIEYVSRSLRHPVRRPEPAHLQYEAAAAYAQEL